MKPTVEQISNLLALKGSEHPQPEYWQDFLCEFHKGQRERQVRSSVFTKWVGSAGIWFSDLGPSKWAYGLGVAYAAVTVAFFLTPQEIGTEAIPGAQIKYTEVPAPLVPTVEQLNQLDLSPATQGNPGEQVF